MTTFGIKNISETSIAIPIILWPILHWQFWDLGQSMARKKPTVNHNATHDFWSHNATHVFLVQTFLEIQWELKSNQIVVDSMTTDQFKTNNSNTIHEQRKLNHVGDVAASITVSLTVQIPVMATYTPWHYGVLKAKSVAKAGKLG